MKKCILVIFGSKSAEHDISIITGLQAIENLDEEKFRVVPIYITRKGKWLTGEKLKKIESFEDFGERGTREVCLKMGSGELLEKRSFGFKKAFKVDCAVVCNHGMNGEDGTLQGVLELSNIPYTSCGVLASSISMDKVIMKEIMRALGYPILDYGVVTKREFLEDREKAFKKLKKLGFPLIVKPSNLGSSIGINRASSKEELFDAIEVAIEYDPVVIVEKALVDFKEINCAVRGNSLRLELSRLEEPNSVGKLLDFKEKYLNFSKGRTSSPNISAKLKKEIEELSTRCYRDFRCKGVVRFDFLVEGERVYINELNSVPGSLSNYLFKESYKRHLNRLIELAEEEFVEKNSYTYSYKSVALKEYEKNRNVNKFLNK